VPVGERFVSRYEADAARYQSRSANHYSPVRHEYMARTAYRQEEGASKRLSSQE